MYVCVLCVCVCVLCVYVCVCVVCVVSSVCVHMSDECKIVSMCVCVEGKFSDVFEMTYF